MQSIPFGYQYRKRPRPNPSLLERWAAKLKTGEAEVIPVYRQGRWHVMISRGNKNYLTVAI